MNEPYEEYSNEDLLYISSNPEVYNAAEVTYARQILKERGVTTGYERDTPQSPVAQHPVFEKGGAGSPYNKISWDFDPESDLNAASTPVAEWAFNLNQIFVVALSFQVLYLGYLKKPSMYFLFLIVCMVGLLKKKIYGWQILQYLAISTLVSATLEFLTLLGSGQLSVYASSTGMISIGIDLFYVFSLIWSNRAEMLKLYDVSEAQKKRSLISLSIICIVLKVLWYFNNN